MSDYIICLYTKSWGGKNVEKMFLTRKLLELLINLEPQLQQTRTIFSDFRKYHDTSVDSLRLWKKKTFSNWIKTISMIFSHPYSVKISLFIFSPVFALMPRFRFENLLKASRLGPGHGHSINNRWKTSPHSHNMISCAEIMAGFALRSQRVKNSASPGRWNGNKSPAIQAALAGKWHRRPLSA